MVLSTNNIAFLLVVPLFMIIRQGMIVVVLVPILSVILIIRLLIIPLLQLSFKIMIPLKKLFNCLNEGLHLPLQCVRRDLSLLVCGGH